MSRQVSRASAGDYYADERASVAGLYINKKEFGEGIEFRN